jgi:hypothetical protein
MRPWLTGMHFDPAGLLHHFRICLDSWQGYMVRTRCITAHNRRGSAKLEMIEKSGVHLIVTPMVHIYTAMWASAKAA